MEEIQTNLPTSERRTCWACWLALVQKPVNLAVGAWLGVTFTSLSSDDREAVAWMLELAWWLKIKA